jgi:hypothetical protein
MSTFDRLGITVSHLLDRSALNNRADSQSGDHDAAPWTFLPQHLLIGRIRRKGGSIVADACPNGRSRGGTEPYRAEFVAVAVQSTFNWYWLVDGLMEAGYAVRLVNTAAEHRRYAAAFSPQRIAVRR